MMGMTPGIVGTAWAMMPYANKKSLEDDNVKVAIYIAAFFMGQQKILRSINQK